MQNFNVHKDSWDDSHDQYGLSKIIKLSFIWQI